MRGDLHTGKMFATLDLGYANLLSGCDRLEHLGRKQRDQTDEIECREVAEAMAGTMEGVRLLEDLSLMPALEVGAREDPLFANIFARLVSDHCEDACYLEEVLEALDALADRRRLSPGLARYMFEGFVRGLRRHVSLERYAISQLMARLPDRDPTSVGAWQVRITKT